jgi:hypothetical protein
MCSLTPISSQGADELTEYVQPLTLSLPICPLQPPTENGTLAALAGAATSAFMASAMAAARAASFPRCPCLILVLLCDMA